jgi:hypothetical protein
MASKLPSRPTPLPGSGLQTDLPDYEAVSFDIEAFDQLLQVHGVDFIHYRAMRCPVGMTDMYDSRRPHEDHSGCSNGFLYKQAGLATAAIMGNSKDVNSREIGFIDGSTMQAVFPRFYTKLHVDDPDTHCHVAVFDRLYLAEEHITVINWQLFESNRSGVEKLQYPVVEIEHLIDSRGFEYSSADYQIKNGQIIWLGGRRPSFDPQSGKGDICSIRYRYRPYWYVSRLNHEVRVSQAEDFSGERKVWRMPYSAVLQRERFFENEDRDDEAVDPTSVRQVKAPPTNPFGVR